MNAQSFKEFRETNDEETVLNYFDSLLFKQYNVLIKAKFEYYGGENRIRYFALKVYPLTNMQNENKALLKRLETYSNMSYQ